MKMIKRIKLFVPVHPSNKPSHTMIFWGGLSMLHSMAIQKSETEDTYCQ